MSNRQIARTAGASLVLAGVALFSMTGCNTQKRSTPIVHDTQIQSTYENESTRVAMGKTLTVQLPTKSGSMYAWRLAPDSAASPHLRMNDRHEQWHPEGGMAYGSDPASDVFTFQARKPGTVTLEFIYDAPPGVAQSAWSRRTVEVEIFDPRLETTTIVTADQSDFESH